MKYFIIQKCGDRNKSGSYSLHSYSNCIISNNTSDRIQLLLIKYDNTEQTKKDSTNRRNAGNN